LDFVLPILPLIQRRVPVIGYQWLAGFRFDMLTNIKEKGTSMRHQKGFTLIEVMIVVAIVAILASIALPSYTSYIQRSRITEAVSGLGEMKVKMEQFFQDNRTYVGACAAGTVAPLPTGDRAKYFDFTCPTLSASQFTVTATGKGNMAGFTYTIDEANVRATTAVPAGWTSSASCWVVKADGSC
jgi:type IV pilus assembly protein PilE